MRAAARRALLPALAFVATALLGSPGLRGAPALPEEVDWCGGHPVLLGRLAALLATALAAAAVTGSAGRDPAPRALLTCLASPALHTLATSAGPESLASLALALALLLRSTLRPLAALLLLSPLPFLLPHAPPADRLRAALFGVWGVPFGPAIGPWRLDVVVPALAAALVLGLLGAGSTWRARLLACAGCVAAAALLGLGAARPAFAAQRGAILWPLAAFAIQRGVARISAGLPRALLLIPAVLAGGVGFGDLRMARDVLDPARRVAWGEAGRMLAVLLEPDASLVARPGVPSPLPRAAGRELEPGEPRDGAPRVLVLSWGDRGGLQAPSSAIEEALAKRGYWRRGELVFGELEEGYARLIARLGVRTPARHYLRVRRYELPAAGP